MDNKELKAATVSSLLWKLMERGGNAVIQLIVQIVTARLLAPEQFGALAIMLVFVNIGNVIVQSGLNTALVQAKDVQDRDYSTVFWMCSSVSVVIYLAIFLAAPSIAAFYALPYLVWPLRGIGLIVVINAYNSIQAAKVTRDLQFRKIFIATISSVVLSAFCGIAAAVSGLGLWALVIQQLVYQLTNCIVLAFEVDWKPCFCFDESRAKEFFEFGWRLLASGLLATVYQSLGNLVIGKQFSSVQLGLVSQGEKYPQAVGSMLDGAIQPVMLSAVAHVQDDLAAVKRLVRRALKTSTYLIFPAMTLFAVVAPNLVPALLGEQWRSSVPFLQIYCFVYALLPIHTTNLQALNGMGRSDLFLKLEIIKKSYGLATLLICAFVLKDVKLLVLSYMLTGLISTFVNASPNKKVIGYSYGEQVRDVLPACALSLVSGAFAFAVTFFAEGSLAVVFGQIVIFMVVYLVLSALFRVETFTYILSMMKKATGR